jgi:type I restriction enzyme S subunit
MKQDRPATWRTLPLGEVATIQTGVAKGKKTKNGTIHVPYLRVANVQDGFLDLSEIKEIEIDPTEMPRYQLQTGDVLFTEGGDSDKLGRGTVWRGQLVPCLHQNHVFAVRPHERVLLPEFLAYVAASPIGKRYFLSCSKQSTNLASINSAQLKKFPVHLPPLPEQQRITAVLHIWDDAISKAERLINSVRLARDTEIQLAVSGQRRCEPVALGQLIEPVTSKAGGHPLPILTISAMNGFIEQQSYFARRIASESLDSYSMLRKGEFAYNRSRATGYPYGAIKRLRTFDRGAVTSLYFCFRSKSDDGSLADYLEALFENSVLNRQLARIAKEGSRAHGLLRTPFKTSDTKLVGISMNMQGL